MRKLLLLLFLFTLTSNALAKVEMWECDNVIKRYYKIDTRNDTPKIYVRSDHKWLEESTLTKVEYKKDDDAIWVYDQFDKIFWLYDLVTKEKIYRPNTDDRIDSI